MLQQSDQIVAKTLIDATATIFLSQPVEAAKATLTGGLLAEGANAPSDDE